MKRHKNDLTPAQLRCIYYVKKGYKIFYVRDENRYFIEKDGVVIDKIHEDLYYNLYASGIMFENEKILTARKRLEKRVEKKINDWMEYESADWEKENIPEGLEKRISNWEKCVIENLQLNYTIEKESYWDKFTLDKQF